MSSCNKENKPSNTTTTTEKEQSRPSKEECKEHSFGEWTVDKNASCSQKGEKSRVCSVCSFMEKQSIDKTAHTPITDERVEPTCTSKGLTEGSHCSVCNEVISKQEVLPTLSHQYGQDGRCSACGICKVHTFGDWEQTKAPSCTEEGIKKRICSVCQAGELQSIEKAPHTPVTDKAVEPTCTSKGLTEGSRCSVCETILVAQEELPMSDHDFTSGDTCAICGAFKGSTGLKLNLIGDNYWVAGIGDCTDKTVYIPSVHEGKPVVGISGYAFRSCTQIEKVVMHDDILTLGEEAFKGCKNLTEVVMSSSITTINPNTFSGCEKLYQLDISNIRTIRYSAFAGSYIKELTIKGNVTLDNGAFADSHVEKVVFESGTLSIPANMFKNTSKLKSVTLPEGITTIGNAAFSNSSIEKLTLPSTLKTVMGNVFENCTKLRSIDFSGASARIINGRNFNSCTSLTEIKNGENLSEIVFSDIEGSALLKNQNGLLIAFGAVFAYDHESITTDVVIPEGVTEIKANVFENCNVIFSISFPSTLKRIGNAAFKGCENISNFIVPEGVTEIGSEAFAQSDAEYIYLPDSLTAVSDRLLYQCYSLHHLSLGKNISSVAEVYFTMMSEAGIETISFRGTYAEYNEMITRIGKDIFPASTVSCTNKDIIKVVKETKPSTGTTYTLYSNGTLIVTGTGIIPYTNPDSTFMARAETLIISEGITKFEESMYSAGAFEGFSKLINIEFPSTFAYVGNTFNRTRWMETITTQETVLINGTTLYFASGLKWGYQVPDHVEKIENGAFKFCPELTTLILPKGLKEIGSRAFENCTSLRDIEIPDGVEIIGSEAFYECNSLTELTIPASIKQLGLIAVSCKNLKKITILKTPEELPASFTVAHSCSALEEVIIGEGIKALPVNTIYECKALKYVVIPESVVSINNSAFWTNPSSVKYLCMGTDAFEILNGREIYKGRVYMYSENTPTDDGLYWHYGENGEILIY